MKVDNRDVYEQIGNLFYAIAADQHVKPLEIAELKLLISRDWLPRNLNSNEHLVSEEAHCILLTMDALQGNKVNAGDAYSDFAKFYGKHPEIFTIDLKQRMLDTASEIVKIFNTGSFASAHFIEMKKLMQLPERSNA